MPKPGGGRSRSGRTGLTLPRFGVVPIHCGNRYLQHRQQNLIEDLLAKDCGRALHWSNRPTSRRSHFSLKVWKMFKVMNGLGGVTWRDR